MAYFNELPNLEVVSRFPNQSSNQDYTTIKNLWRRAKLREDISNAITAFNYYQIKDGERPDQIAEKIYGDPELDWVILVTNNITNLNEEWPLDNNSFYEHLIDKYGSENELQKLHHSQTIEQKDKYSRLVVPGELLVDDSSISNNFKTNDGVSDYVLSSFLPNDDSTIVSINFIQGIFIHQRTGSKFLNLIIDIEFETSNLKVKSRSGNNIDITVNNDLATFWPASWGGALTIKGREQNIICNIEDLVDSNYTINIPGRLYEVVGELVDGNIIPTFRFRYLPSG